MAKQEGTERFDTAGGRVVGYVGLVLLAAVSFGELASGDGPVVPLGCGLAAVVAWTVLIRPAVKVRDGRLVLRNPVGTVSIPLAAVEEVEVRQYLAVTAGGRRYTNPGVGRSRRQSFKDERLPQVKSPSYGAFVEIRLRRLAEDARRTARITEGSEEQRALAEDVRRTRAWPELATFAVLAVALVVAIVLG